MSSIFEKIESLPDKSLVELKKFLQAVSQEKEETKEAAHIFKKHLKGEEVSEEENEKLKQQFYDVLKGIGIVIPSILIPGSSVLIPSLVYLAKKWNIDILPSAFYEQNQKTHNMNNIKINEETTVYPGFLKVKEASVTETLQGGKEINYTRQKLCRADAVGVFIYNKETDSVILIKQFRYAINNKHPENLLEIVAGKIDKGETPSNALGREVEEEIGYNLKPENVFYLTKTFMSCGYTDERVYLYAAIVTNEDKVGLGGGLDSECENIETIEMKMSEFLKLLSENELEDAKTLLAGHLSVNLFKSKNLI